MRLAKYSLISAVVLALTYISTNTLAQEQLPPINPEGLPTSIDTVFDMMEAADYTLLVDVVKVTNHSARGGLPEPYSIVHLVGSVVNSSGLTPFKGRYLLRVYGDISTVVEGSRRVMMVTRNGENPIPIQAATSDSPGGNMIGNFPIVNNEVYLRDKPILFLNHGFPVTGQHFNTCSVDEELARSPQYTAEDIISFQCLDGSQWNKGNDRPEDWDDTPMTEDEFVGELLAHMASLNLPDANIRRGLRAPPDGPLLYRNRLDHTEKMDNHWAKRYRDNPVLIDELSGPGLDDLYARMKARGKLNELPARVREVVESRRPDLVRPSNNNANNSKGN